MESLAADDLHGTVVAAVESQVEEENCQEIVGGPRGIFLCQNDRGQPTGEAFIEMETQADVDTALEKHKQNMGRRWVRVGWSGAGGEGMAWGGVESQKW